MLALKADQLESCQNLLIKARGLLTANYAARILSDLARVWGARGEDFSGLDWREAENFARELLEARPSTESVMNLAREKLKWLEYEKSNMAQLARIRQLSESRKWTEAMSASDELAADSDFRVQGNVILEHVRSEYVRELRDQADEAYENRRWHQARQAYTELIVWIPQNEQKPFIDRIDRCRRNEDERQQFDAVKKQMENGDYDSVIRVAGTTSSSSAYYSAIKELGERASAEREIAGARLLYDQGQGQEALIRLRKVSGADADALRVVIKKVLDAQKAGETELAAKNVSGAIEEWETIVTREKHARNQYHIDAEALLEKWKDPRNVAEACVQWGNEAYGRKDFAGARALFKKAGEFDAALGEKSLREMNLRSTYLFNKALSLRKDKPVDARVMIEEALMLVDQSFPLYGEMRDELMKLP
ncbi:MAG: hypothetical protein HQL31_08685 [Planctomycetes bacterium]|nr:hypothetical protein [Planctomycetota bacterium]